jgi:hypothetical protein
VGITGNTAAAEHLLLVLVLILKSVLPLLLRLRCQVGITGNTAAAEHLLGTGRQNWVAVKTDAQLKMRETHTHAQLKI